MLMLNPSHNMWQTCDDRYDNNKTRRPIVFGYSKKKTHCITETIDNLIIATAVKLL